VSYTDYCHYKITASADDLICVELSEKAYIRILDSANYSSFCASKKHRYHGRRLPRKSLRISLNQRKRTQTWHVVIIADNCDEIITDIRVAKQALNS
jgi:hypothetical protein